MMTVFPRRKGTEPSLVSKTYSVRDTIRTQGRCRMADKRGGVTRRGLLWAGGLAAIPLAPAGAFTYQAGGMPWESGAADNPRAADPRPGYLFFDAAEASFIESASERMVPPDEHGPGAKELGIPFFIDRQLAGPYGQG